MSKYQLQLRHPGRYFLLAATLLASAIPMSIGVYLVLPLVIAVACESGIEMICRDQNPNTIGLMFFQLPIALTFLLATPIVALTSLRAIEPSIDTGRLEMTDIISASGTRAFIGHIVSAIIHWIVLFIILFIADGISAVTHFPILILLSIFIHIFLLALITLPLCLLCALVFRAIAFRWRKERNEIANH